MTGHLVYPILAPLGAAVLCLALHRSVRAQRLVSLTALASIIVYAGGWLWPALGAGQVLTLRLGGWPAPFGIVLAVDVFSGIMLTLSGVTGLAVLIFAVAWLDGGREEPFFYPLYLVLFMGIHGAFLTGDLFNLYVFFEVLLVASFGLAALGGSRAQIEGTIRYLVASQVSSALFLVGVGLLYGVAGTLNMADLATKLAGPLAAPYVAVVAPLFLVAFGIKAAIFPLFFWLPASYPAAKTPVTAIFGGLLTKVGIYALIRCYTLLLPAQWQAHRGLLLGIAILTMVVGVLGAVAQSDVKRLLSFHIISQIGYLIMGLGLSSRLALAATLYFMVHIVLVKTSLLLIAGLLERMTGTTDLYAMGGLLRRRPGVAVLFLTAALALAGAPPLSGFVAKFGLVLAGLQGRAFVAVAVALGVSMLTLFSMIKIWTQAFMKQAPATAAIAPLGGTLVASTIGLVAVAVLAAVLAAPVWAVANQAAGQLLDVGPYVSAVLGNQG
ncbi:MAG TPA: proton-conducting transporter membrane subunit [Anaerolineae bacterium]|nr:proton-conducting transporter membrane subunit [Anaerolineae bacterium]HOQ98546.1 proton-conducting transporter membrane subunit [Anaerolineae bacterium]HPL27046.1 proton-conducting transporter membrane subunit [Anaerolineae bacterium]